MSRRMSCSITVEAVRDRTKTVTRRHVDTWSKLAAGDRLTLIERGMGLKKGESQVVLAEVEIVDVRVEPLAAMTDADCTAEGFPGWPVERFAAMWLRSHGHHPASDPATVEVRRIEWRYLP